MKQYKGIIYDIDGTLLNTVDMNLYPLLRIIQEETGETWTLEQVLPFYAQPGLKTMDDLGIRDKEKTYARWVTYVNAYEKGAQVYEGITAALAAIHHAGIRQGIVSSKMRRQYQIDVVSKGLDRYMETAVLAEDTLLHKPDPEPILECLRRMDLAPEEVLYVGDALSDYQAARSAGVDFGYAKWGSIFTEGLQDVPLRFERPEELVDFLVPTE